jgi:hypothetical protein
MSKKEETKLSDFITKLENLNENSVLKTYVSDFE